MRYVIVSVVKGEAGEFNNKLRKDLFERYKAKSSKLPAHFTIKAPFEYSGDISELEEAIENFCKNEKAYPYAIEGYNHFDNRVIYMKVKMSKEGKKVHDNLIDEISKFPYIEFSKSDGKNKVFHVTLSSKRIQNIYDSLWNYVNEIPCKFKCKFDNVCIYRWENNTWELHREFLLNLE
ncbi:MAG: 2'-5' RNA ligase family protein [Clostridiales bacterium]|nr:2'-5' RNA ligase family protein [Clostridiales bacterium]